MVVSCRHIKGNQYQIFQHFKHILALSFLHFFLRKIVLWCFLFLTLHGGLFAEDPSVSWTEAFRAMSHVEFWGGNWQRHSNYLEIASFWWSKLAKTLEFSYFSSTRIFCFDLVTPKIQRKLRNFERFFGENWVFRGELKFLRSIFDDPAQPCAKVTI